MSRARTAWDLAVAVLTAVIVVVAGVSVTLAASLHLWGAAVSFAAQSAAAQPARVEFDVASVKPHPGDPGDARGISFSPSGRFAWTWMTVKQLMSSAYSDVEFKQIAGGPDWIDSARFDIVATSPDALKEMNPDGTPRGLFLRLRTLLEDRFQLKTHVEQREIAVYALQAASTPMVMGPALKKTDIDCEAVMREMAAGRRPQLPYGQVPPCALSVRPGQLTGHAITMAQVISVLTGPSGRPIVDRTGLTGSYDAELKWAPEFPPGALLNGAPPPVVDGLSLFTALREQLGLKLEATRATVPVLVIDSASLPMPD